MAIEDNRTVHFLQRVYQDQYAICSSVSNEAEPNNKRVYRVELFSPGKTAKDYLVSESSDEVVCLATSSSYLVVATRHPNALRIYQKD